MNVPLVLLNRRRQGGAFSPTRLFALAEPGVWYDPSDLTTLFQDTAGTTPVTTPGQTVARINDKSGRGFHATQSILASRPTYQVVNGRPCLSFDGIDDFLVTPTITPGIGKAQVFAGVRKIGVSGFAIIAELSATVASNNGAFAMLGPNGTSNDYGFASRGSAFVEATANGFESPITSVITGLGDISGDIATLRVNGTQAAQSTADQGTGNYLAYPLYIGRRNGTTLPFNGNIFSLIVRFGANLDANTITNTETWVNGKTGAY